MLILQKPKLIINNPGNADISELSDYPQEEEVLVFPVCALGIDDIEKVGNIYYIKLKYLEDYEAIKNQKLNKNNNNNNYIIPIIIIIIPKIIIIIIKIIIIIYPRKLQTLHLRKL